MREGTKKHEIYEATKNARSIKTAVTSRELGAELGYDPDFVSATLCKLCNEGLLQRQREDKPFKYWRPRKKATPQPREDVGTKENADDKEDAMMRYTGCNTFDSDEGTTHFDPLQERLARLQEIEAQVERELSNREQQAQAAAQVLGLVLATQQPHASTQDVSDSVHSQIDELFGAQDDPALQTVNAMREYTATKAPAKKAPRIVTADRPLHVFYDIELVRSWQEVDAKSAATATPEQIKDMGIACVVTASGYIDDIASFKYDFFLCVDVDSIVQDPTSGEILSFAQDSGAVMAFVQTMYAADVVHSFNGKHFDDYIFEGICSPAKWNDREGGHIDLCEIVKAGRRRFCESAPIQRSGSLDNLARHTLGDKKLDDGLGAIEMLKQGRIDELRAYCQHDVELNLALEMFARRYGFLVDDFGLVPVEVPGGVAAFKLPGRFWEGRSPNMKKPITTEQQRKLRDGKEGVHGPLCGEAFAPARCLTMVEASNMIDALLDWHGYSGR